MHRYYYKDDYLDQESYLRQLQEQKRHKKQRQEKIENIKTILCRKLSVSQKKLEQMIRKSEIFKGQKINYNKNELQLIQWIRSGYQNFEQRQQSFFRNSKKEREIKERLIQKFSLKDPNQANKMIEHAEHKHGNGHLLFDNEYNLLIQGDLEYIVDWIKQGSDKYDAWMAHSISEPVQKPPSLDRFSYMPEPFQPKSTERSPKPFQSSLQYGSRPSENEPVLITRHKSQKMNPSVGITQTDIQKTKNFTFQQQIKQGVNSKIKKIVDDNHNAFALKSLKTPKDFTLQKQYNTLVDISHANSPYYVKPIKKLSNNNFIMEYLSPREGWTSLGEVLTSTIPINPRLKKMWWDHIKKAVDELHTMDYAHRDLSEENIMINTNTNDIKIVDFSCAIKRSDDSDFATNKIGFIRITHPHVPESKISFDTYVEYDNWIVNQYLKEKMNL